MGLIAAGVGAVGAIAGAAMTSSATKDAAKTAADASMYSAQLQEQNWQTSYANQLPFIQQGQGYAGELNNELTSGWLGMPMNTSGMPTAAGVPNAPSMSGVPQFSWDPNAAGGMPTRGEVPQFNWNPTQAGLEQTPGYQFTLQQGLKGVQNAAAARGLGVSGAALKGAADYSTGLADKTYNQQLQNAINQYQQQLSGFTTGTNVYNSQVTNATNMNAARATDYGLGLNTYGQQLAGYTTGASQYQNQFLDYWANQNNRYDNLYKLANLGANTSVSAGTQAVDSGKNVGNALASAGAQQAAGTLGAANAWNTGLNNATQNLLNNPNVQNYLQQQNWLGGGSGTMGNAGYSSNDSILNANTGGGGYITGGNAGSFVSY